jgi:ArsR family transcriptional regulator
MRKPLPDEGIEPFANILKILANPARLKLLNTIVTGEYTVTELCKECKLKQSLVSQQLKNLRLNNIICRRKEAPRVYYRLKEKNIARLLQCLKKCNSGI